MLDRKQKEKEIKEKSFLFNRFYSGEVTYKKFRSSLPINVSHVKVKRVYRILDALFKRVEVLDGRVTIEPYVGKDVANICLGNHLYEFEVKEISDKTKAK